MIMGLPFSFVIFFVMAGLYKSLKVEDYRRVSASRDTAPRPMGLQDRLSWKKRLSRLMNYPGTRYTKLMMETIVLPGDGGGGAGAAAARRRGGTEEPAAGRG
ncbi:hypothetical protein MJK72_08435 [Klebsiella pneumoniae]|nr:hypothetical protein MJK72_08435 [Klebsiella pneumoniae]